MPIQHIVLLATVYTTLDVMKTKPKPLFHIVGGAILLLQSLVRRSHICQSLALYKVLVLACITHCLLIELVAILAMRQWEEGKSVSNINVLCDTSCSTKFKASSMHVLLALVFG